MAATVRKALVQIAGELVELPPADVIDLLGSRDIAPRNGGFGPVDLIPITQLFAAGGHYLISAFLKITTVGTSPVAGPITLTFDDGDGGVSQSMVMPLFSTTGALVTTTVNNSTTTGTVHGSIQIYAKNTAAIRFSIGVSGTFGAGLYAAHLRCKYLG
jgi:hypothetical protein